MGTGIQVTLSPGINSNNMKAPMYSFPPGVLRHFEQKYISAHLTMVQKVWKQQ
jgi:hypothetical protein